MRPERILVAAGVCAVTLFLIGFGWIEVTKIAKRRVEATVAKASKKLGVPIEIGKWAITPTGAHFDDVRIGAEANVVISRVTAEVGLNPFSGSFGELDSVNVFKVRVKAGLGPMRGQVASLKEAGLLADQPGGAGAKAVEKLFQALPAQRFYVQSAGVRVVDDDGKALLTVKGLKVLIEKRESRVLFTAAAVKTATGVDEELLQGRFELAPKSSEYRFFVRRKRSAQSKANAWAVSGVLPKDLAGAELTVELHRLPSILEPFVAKYQDYLGKPARLDLRARVSLSRDGEAWRFNGRVQSLGSTVLIPLVSLRPLGPMQFDARASGRVDLEEKALAVDSLTVTLPQRQTRRYGKSPVRLSATGTGRLVQNEDGESSVSLTGHAVLDKAPCQLLLDSSPVGLLPALTDFKLEGSAGAGVDFDFDGLRPEAASVSLRDPVFGCKVLEAPYAYSAEHLAGPFSLQREVGKDDKPLEINVSPLATTFTPLESISRNSTLAFVSSEDASFYTHKGIDPFAIESAVKRDLAEKRVAVGGSTITMQTVKNLFLGPERTLSRKLQELFLAWHLEQVLSKERILEIYMNIVELGPGIYGITQAADHYFGKHPFDLSLLESAYLANLLPAPKARYRYFCEGKLSPNFHELMTGLLKRMLNLNKINYERYLQAMSASLQFNDVARQASKECTTRTSEPESSGREGTWGGDDLPRGP